MAAAFVKSIGYSIYPTILMLLILIPILILTESVITVLVC
jgi:hypothetical protein